MTKGFIRFSVLAAALFVFCVPYSKADTIASMQFTSAGSNADYGVHIGPYTASINAVSTLVICDDFSDETYVGETWTATLSTYPSLANVQFDQGAGNTTARTKGYDELAWLAIQLMGSTNTSQTDAIQFAIWSVFDPSGVASYLNAVGGHSFDTNSSNANGVQYWLNQAAGQTFTAGEFSNVSIYTPNSNYAMSCSNDRHEACPPQEFITVETPEPGTLAFMGLGLLAMFFAAKTVKRRSNGGVNVAWITGILLFEATATSPLRWSVVASSVFFRQTCGMFRS
jgi:hypothetical protein